MPYKDPIARRAAQARYRAIHGDKIRENRAEKIDTIRAQQRARYHSNPQKYRDYSLRRLYGITSADYERMFQEQDGKCAVCKTCDFVGPGKKLHVDHDHKTGLVRGLICVRCNVLIGMAQEQPARFRAAIIYLERHNLTDPLLK